MEANNFKVGDWVIHDFKMKQVTEIDDNHQCVSDGYFSTSGCHLLLRAATLKNKRMAEFCQKRYDQLYEKHDRAIRNWPDLHRWFEGRCIQLIDAPKEQTEALMDDTVNFCKEIDDSIQGRKTVRGIKL